MNNLNYTHLLYVRKYSIFTNDYELYVYGVNSRDIFHTIGEIYYRSLEHIQRITYVVLTDENRKSKFDFLAEHNLKIYDWYDKYNY